MEEAFAAMTSASRSGGSTTTFFGQGVADASRNNDLFREEARDLSTQGITVTIALGF